MQSHALDHLAGGRAIHLLPLSGDERLARLAGDGSERAFAALYERYHQPLYRYCRSMVRHDADAQDALQSTFANAFSALVRGRRDAPLRPWLYRIAHNEAITLIRRRRPEIDLEAAGDQPTPSAADVAGERARLALLVADLAELTERQRGALVMRELGGLSHAEIESALQMAAGTAKQTILEARRSLAEFAQGRAMICDDICRAISDGSGRTLRARRIRAHLRDCAGCAAFAAAIPARSRDLRALTPPLPAAAAAGLLSRALGAGSTHAGGSGTSATAAGLATKTAGLTLSTKVLAGAAAVVTAAAGTTGAVTALTAGNAARQALSSAQRASPAGTHAAAAGPGVAAGVSATRIGATTPAGTRHPVQARQAGRGRGNTRTSHGKTSSGHGNSTTAHGNSTSAHGRAAATQPVAKANGAVHGTTRLTHSVSGATPATAKLVHRVTRAPPSHGHRSSAGQTSTSAASANGNGLARPHGKPVT